MTLWKLKLAAALLLVSSAFAGNYPIPAPGTAGNVLTSASGKWTSAIATGGSGGINYLSGDDTNQNVTVGNWLAYADAAATTPVDGTGGSPTVTCTRTTSSPLRGAGSLLVTKDAANRQGNGCAIAFAPDSADQAKPIAVSFDYTVASGTYADSDLNVYLYDVTNATVIQPAPYKILSAATGLSQRWIGYFQTSSSSVSYRLIIHAQSTSASAYTVKVDNVIVGPTYQPYGAVQTDGGTWTPTGLWTGGNVTYTGKKRRNGQYGEYEVNIALAGAPTGAGGLYINMPSGEVIDTSAFPVTPVASYTVLDSSGTLIDSATNQYPSSASYKDTTSVYANLFVASGTYTTGTTPNLTTPVTFGNVDSITLRWRVPIVGWSSNVQTSQDAETRVVAARMTGATATVTGTYSDITWTTIASDTHGSMGTTTYTIPSPGYYDFSGAVSVGATSLSAAGGFYISLYNSTTSTTLLENQFIFDLNVPENESLDFNYRSVYLTAGTAIKIQIKTTGTVGTPVINSSATLNHFGITKSLGPAQIAASEKVYLQYTGNGGAAQTANTTKLDFTTKVTDSHGAWTSNNTFTAPRAGWYVASGLVHWGATANIGINIYVNNVQKYSSGVSSAAVNVSLQMFNYATYLNQGDTMDFRADTNCTLTNSAVNHWISIWSQ